jgi:hypothetical protein
MIASLILPLLLQSVESATSLPDPSEVEGLRIAALSASLRTEAARCYNDYPREAACFSEAYDKAASAVADETTKLEDILRAADADYLADCDEEQAATALGCSRDLLATHMVSQILWQQYADTQCSLDGLPSRGGWGQRANYNACFIRMAADRIDTMWAGMGVFTFQFDAPKEAP